MIASQMETQIASSPEGQELDLSLGRNLFLLGGDFNGIIYQ